MTRILRYAFVSLLAVGTTASLTGCKADCDTEGGTTKCEGETTTQYVSSTPVFREVAWAAGQSVKISVQGANVRVGDIASTSITVNPGGAPADCKEAATKVCVKFTAIHNDTKENRDRAVQQMKLVEEGGMLAVSAAAQGNDILISAGPSGSGAGSGLSALVDVFLPPAFDGQIVANTGTGAVSVIGAKNSVSAKTGLGAIAIDVAGTATPGNYIVSAKTELGDIAITMPAGAPAAGVVWGTGASGDEYSLRSDQGDIQLTVPVAANMDIQALAEGPGANISLSFEAPAGWKQQEGSTATAATYCGNAACDGSVKGGLWEVAAKFGSINLVFR